MIKKIRFIIIVSMSLILLACSGTPKRSDQQIKKAARYNVQLGLGYLAQGKLDLAQNKLSKALDQDSSLPDAHAAYALLQGRLGKDDLAEKHFRKALRSDPENSEVLNNYGSYLCERKRIVEAEEYFMRALNDPLYKTPEYAYANAGICALKIPDYDKAEAYIRKALDKNPRFANALFHMAKIKAARREYKLAKAYLDRYHEIGNKNPDSLWLGIQLAKRLGDRNTAASFALYLKNNFPQSEQAQRLAVKGR